MDKLACSHSRAWELYAESVLTSNENVFQSRECFGRTDLTPITSDNCQGANIWPAVNITRSMGFYANKAGPAPVFPTSYWLATNNASTYSLT